MYDNFIDYCYIPPYNNSFYFISGDEINLNIALDADGNIIKYSNDYLFLIKNLESKAHELYNFVNKNKNKFLFLDEDVIPFITTFNIAIHGYCGINNILKNYINNIELYKNKKIIVYKNASKGILDTIKYFCDINIINHKDIIYLDNNVIYKFKSITIIPNTLHSYFENINIRDEISDFFKKYIFDYTIPDSYKVDTNYENIAVIKHKSSQIASHHGSANYSSAFNLMEKLNYKIIEPSEYNEIQFMQILHNCKKVVFSWGTTFMKNFIYLSDKCDTMVVYIIGNAFINEYNYLLKYNKLFNKYKNCNIEYKIVNEDLI